MLERADSRTSEMLKQLLPESSTTTNDWAKEPGSALIVAEEKSLETANAQFALCMAVNALSRLYPIITHICVSIPDSCALSVNVPLFAGRTIRDALIDFISRLRPNCKAEFADVSNDYWDAALCIGPSKNELKNAISIASDGWVAYVSTNKLSTCFTEKSNPIGAYTAACIGGMEVFKKVFLKKSNLIAPEKEPFDVRWRLRFIEGLIAFSAFDYRVHVNHPRNPPLPSCIDLGDLCMAGLGAGGGAAAYALASLHGLQGRLRLIDPDEVKAGNMNRYLYALDADSIQNAAKVHVVKGLFRRFERLDLQEYACSYQELKESEKIGTKDVLISTVDTKETRRSIQWDMPRVILDAAVVSTEFYVRRVDIGRSPCLLCTHKADKVERPVEEVLSEVASLNPKEIIRLRSTNALFTQEHINQMRKSSEMHGFALPSVSDHFSDWLIRHCGELASPAGRERIPLPFATILAGILIAGEVIKDRHFPNDSIQNFYSYDMINVPHNGPIQLKPVTGCIFCSFPKTKEMYAKKYTRV
jgi:molybdopterin/thiamine biosynthesis adenylyltransferase